MLQLPRAVIFRFTLSTPSHLEVHYENNYQNDGRPLGILSPEEVQQREPKLPGLIKARLPYIRVKHTSDTDTRSSLQYLGTTAVNPVKVDVKSSRSEHGIPKQHLFQAHLILEPYTGKAVHTFLVWCYTISESQLFHSTLFITNTAGSSGLYLSVASQKMTSTYIPPIITIYFL